MMSVTVPPVVVSASSVVAESMVATSAANAETRRYARVGRAERAVKVARATAPVVPHTSIAARRVSDRRAPPASCASSAGASTSIQRSPAALTERIAASMIAPPSPRAIGMTMTTAAASIPVYATAREMPSTSPATCSSRSKGRSVNHATSRTVENRSDTRAMTHGVTDGGRERASITTMTTIGTSVARRNATPLGRPSVRARVVPKTRSVSPKPTCAVSAARECSRGVKMDIQSTASGRP